MTIETARKNLGTAQKALKDYEVELFDRREAEFFRKGGCKTCNGQGNVCVWGTLDSLTGGYDEFGPCPDCDGKRQPWVGVNRRRRSQHPKVPASQIPALARTEEEEVDRLELVDAVDNAQKALDTVKAQWEIIKGSRVKVVRGRKTPKGTVGTVFWMGAGQSYGYYDAPKTRVGIKTDDGVTHWVNNIDYCELINPRTEDDLDAAQQAAKRGNVARNLTHKGSEIVSKRVSGKVAWAGYTKKGSGPWRALVKSQGQDYWLDATEITTVNGNELQA